MFRALTERVSNFLSPDGRGSPKRKRTLTDDTEDVAPVKRSKTELSSSNNEPYKFWNYKWNWRFGPFRKTEKPSSVVEIVEEESELSILRSEDVEMTSRKFLTASRKKDRLPIPHISNTTVLDLTIDDDDDDEIQLTKVTIDLTSPLLNNTTTHNRTNDIERTDVSVDLTGNCGQLNRSTSSLFSRYPSTNMIGPLRRQKSGSLLHETVRLDERTRYKTLLAQYTNILLPEYSKSISPLKSSTSVTDALVTSLSSSFGRQEEDSKPALVDLTDSSLNISASSTRSTPGSTGRKFFHELLSETRRSPPSFRFSSTSPAPLSLSTPKTEASSNNVSSNSLLDTDWFKKWRETLDPVSLERERRITEEEQRKDAIKRKQQEDFEELEKKNREKAKEATVLVELTLEMKATIKKALGPGSARDVLVEGFNAEITRADIATLRPSVWLNDEVVNFYFNLIKQRSEQDGQLPKIHVFNTFFYPKIEKTGHSSVKRWTRKVDIFAVDLILLPVHLGMHWCMAAIDNRTKQIIYYDSLRGNNPKCIATLRKYLNDESMDKKKRAFDFEGWTESMPKEIPEQMNGCDCGVFACKYAEYKSRDSGFTFTQANMPYFRQRMVYEIVAKKLL